MTRQDWKDDLKLAYNENEPLLLTATRDPINNGEKTFVIDFQNLSLPLGKNIWHGYDVDDLQVST